ncbi:MAG: hypothetical protein JOZ81_32725, partial [Chloroflexi bacterium]|nr:hypothetical protein [Chloroflexota bacterium]
MQQSIFMDLAWQHAAYMHGGLQAMTALANTGALEPNMFAAWQQIASGDPSLVAAGNTALLYRKQHDILDPQYADIRTHNGPEGRIFTDVLSENTASPLPSGAPFRDVVCNHFDVPIGNANVGIDTADVTVFDDRWKWITGDMMP